MQHQNPPDHARHDATLIAGRAAGDLTETERVRADALLAECDACGELRRDLVAIAAATRSVPPPATLAHDLRLAPEQADRLRRGSWLRTFLRPFGAATSPVRPLATAFTSLGVVGLVVGVTLSSGIGFAGIAGGPASAPGGEDRAHAPAPAATAGAAENQFEAEDGSYLPVMQSSGGQVIGGGAQGTSIPPDRTVVDMSKSNRPSEPAAPTSAALGENKGGNRDVATPGDADNEAASLSATSPPNPLIAGSLALLGIGLLLFGLRIASRRVR